MESTVIVNMVTMEFMSCLDTIFIFEKGHLRERGNPKQLLSNQGSILHTEVNEIAPHLIKELVQGN